MEGPARVTAPFLDVVEVFLQAFEEDEELYGWAIMKAAARSGPTVYNVLDRLEDVGWVSARWEDENPDPSKPRRRFYRLTPNGLAAASELLAKRRPRAVKRLPRSATGLAFGGRMHGLLPGGAR